MTICPPDKCSGCYACASICPQHCITMNEDKYGELHPIVDENKCTHCKLCVKTCPQNLSIKFNYPQSCSASWITDAENRKLCASGGIATTLAEYIIKEKKGVVFGSCYNADLIPVMTYTDKLEDLIHFKGSRYVQSVIGYDTFKQVKKILTENKTVLFIGTPCQIAGLYGFLKHYYENLITVDLICHGVNPTYYFTEEIKYICNHYKIPFPMNVRFRGNDGNNFRLTLWNDKGKCMYECRAYEQPYFAGFMLGVTLRENCYQCPYARPERIADITIGDFIGLGKNKPFNYNKENVSSVTLNTNKGKDFYNAVSSNRSELTNIPRDYKERLEYAPSLLIPYKRHTLNTRFRKLIIKHGYIKAVRKTLGFEITKNIIRRNFYYYKHALYRFLGIRSN